MYVTEQEPDELTTAVRAWEQSRTGRNRAGRLSAAHELAKDLVRNTWLLPVAGRAVREDTDLLGRLREGPFAEAVQAKLAGSGAPYPFYARRLQAVLDAAEAARHLRHGRQAEARAHLDAALAAWGPGQVAHAQVMDLVESLCAEPGGPEPAAQMSVPIRGRDPGNPVTLVAAAVELTGGRESGAWPCPRETAFTEIDPETAAEAAAITVAPGGGREAGLRWWIVAASGQALHHVPRTPLAAPLAVLAESLALGTRLDPSITVVARLGGESRLLPADEPEELVRFAERNGKRVVLGMENVPGERARLPRVGTRMQRELAAPDVAAALRLARKRPSRRLGWTTVGTAVALLAVAGGYALHRSGDSAAEAERQESARTARVLAGQVRAAADPEGSLLRALAAQRIAPGSTGARSALLNAVYGDLRLRGLLRSPLGPLRTPAMSADGRTAAAGGGKADITVWALGAAPSPSPRIIRTGGAVTALAMAPDGRTLAYAGPSSVVRTVALTPAGRDGALPLPAKDTAVRALAFSPSGSELAAATSAGALLWSGTARNREAGSSSPTRLADGSAAAGIAFAPKGRSLAVVGTGGDVSFWRVDGARAERTATSDLGAPGSSVTYDAEGKSLLALTTGGVLHALDPRTGKRLYGPVTFAAGSRLLSATADGPWVAFGDGLAALDTRELRKGNMIWNRIDGEGARVGNTAAMGGEGPTTVLPAGDDVLALRGKADHRMFERYYVAGVTRAAVLPGSGKMLFQLQRFGRYSVLAVFDTRSGRLTAQDSFLSKADAFPSGVLSARTRSAALVAKDGRVLMWRYDGQRDLKRIAELPPPPGDALRPKVAMDEDRGRLFVAWRDRLITYAYDGTAPPQEISRSPLREPFACMALDARRARIIGCTASGVKMWPMDGRGRAGEPISLGSRAAVQAVVTANGAVVGVGPSGDAFAYGVRGSVATERALPGESQYIHTLTAVGNVVVVSARTGYLSVIDVDSGERLLRVRYPEIASPPFATWQDAGGLHLALGFQAFQLDVIIDPARLAAHACRMGGWNGPSPSVGDVVSDAPARLRGRPLCPAG